MKLKKLPTVVIKNPFGEVATISKKICKLTVAVKLFVATLIIAISSAAYLVGSTAYLKYVETEQKFSQNFQQTLQGEDDTIIIQATAKIIVEESKGVPLPVAKQYAKWIYEAASKYSVDPFMILAVMRVESQFDYKAVSPTGPIGLMQVASSFHKEKSTKAALFDPKNNIHVGAQILREYSNDGKRTDVETLLRYNASPIAVSYAAKVIANKKRFEDNIYKSFVENI